MISTYFRNHPFEGWGETDELFQGASNNTVHLWAPQSWRAGSGSVLIQRVLKEHIWACFGAGAKSLCI